MLCLFSFFFLFRFWISRSCSCFLFCSDSQYKASDPTQSFPRQESTQDLFEHKSNAPKCSIIINLTLNIFTALWNVETCWWNVSRIVWMLAFFLWLSFFANVCNFYYLGSAHWCSSLLFSVRCSCLLSITKKIKFCNFFCSVYFDLIKLLICYTWEKIVEKNMNRGRWIEIEKW